MIDPKYGLKYSFPHSLVHIVDNSMYTGEVPVTQTYDPSLFATIVVTGMPMGVDNKIVTVTRSDVLNKAFGISGLSTSDIEKYGQAVEYPLSLINQNAPVKLLRVTPDDAKYAVAVLYLDWRITTDAYGTDTLETRLNVADLGDLAGRGIYLHNYQNPERLANATFSKLPKDVEANDGGPNWNRDVLITYVSAGRGSAYNNFVTYINESSNVQMKAYGNSVYNFGTIDTRTNEIVESFTASLINTGSKLSAYGIVSMMDTVNIQMKKRLDGSSIMIPYVNEKLIKNLYNKWHSIMETTIKTAKDPVYITNQKLYKEIFTVMDENLFDPIYGRVIIDDTLIDIPNYQVDMVRTDFEPLDEDHLILINSKNNEAEISAAKRNAIATIFTNKIDPIFDSLYGMRSGYTMSSPYSISPTPGTMYLVDPEGHPTINIIAAIDQLSGVVSSVPIPKLWSIQKVNAHTEWAALTEEPTGWNTGAFSNYYKKTGTAGTDEDYELLSDSDKATPTWVANKYYTKTVDGTTDVYTVQTTEPDDWSTDYGNYYYKVGDAYRIVTDAPVFATGTYYKKTEFGDSVDFAKAKDSEGQQLTIRDPYGVQEIAAAFEYEDVIKVSATNRGLTDVTLDSTKVLELVNKSVSKIDNLRATNITNSANPNTYGNIIAVYYKKEVPVSASSANTAVNTVTQFKLYQVNTIADGKVTELLPFPSNYYTALYYESYYSGANIHALINFKDLSDYDITEETIASKKAGALNIDNSFNGHQNEDGSYVWYDYYSGSGTASISKECDILSINEYPEYDANDNFTGYHEYKCTPTQNFFVGNVPTIVSVGEKIVNDLYDVLVMGYADDSTDPPTPITETDKYPALTEIHRYEVTGSTLSTFTIVDTLESATPGYYTKEYGINVDSEHGAMRITGGYSGFFDDDTLSSIEFKLKYSSLLTKGFRGEIDPRIKSVTRVPAKFMFDAGYNTVLNLKVLPYAKPTTYDVILASTIFTDDEKKDVVYDSSLLSGKVLYEDIDVKQAMYDLMIERCYQGIPEDKRPIGPGSGLTVHFDAGFTDLAAIDRINESFTKRFKNPNASWDIGGYTSSVTGITYTYVKRIVDNLFRHCNQYTINKPFVNKYSVIDASEFTDFFPNIDATSWELEDKMYQAGGNCWILDNDGNIRRNSQKTLYREPTGTSDLLQENNMRTLSQLVYLVQTEINNWLIEYADDGILASMNETVNNIFGSWVGTNVEALSITFNRDTNIDGGDIVVCNINVTFRGLVLRVPIIVNVNRRES